MDDDDARCDEIDVEVSLSLLVRRWNLSGDEAFALAGDVGRHERVAQLTAINGALCALHQGELAREWLRRPNTNSLFRGRTPLEVMAHGGLPAMVEVRALLEGRLQGL